MTEKRTLHISARPEPQQLQSQQQEQPEIRSQAPEPEPPEPSQPITPASDPSQSSDIVGNDDYLTRFASANKRMSADTVTNQDTGEVMQPEMDAKQPKKQMDPLEAKNKTERLIKFRDFLQSRGLAYATGDVNEHEVFALSKFEFDMLVDCYNDIVLEMGYIPKWFDIVIAELMVMGPRIFKVFQMRKQIAAEDAKRQQIQQNPAFSQSVEQPTRKSKTAAMWWQVDENGCYLRDLSGRYVKRGDPKEKADLSDYEMLVRHNGKEKIDRIFNINENG